MSDKIKISKEKKEEMILLIKSYFATERDENLGDLAASLILDFFIEKLGPQFYNQGVLDAHAYMSDKIEELYEIQKY